VLGLAYGAKPETFMGLAGVGDISLTCSDDKSRNRQLGLLLAQGLDLKQVQTQISQAIEGANAAPIIASLAQAKNIDMPITTEVVKILSGEITPKEAAHNLLIREYRAE
jgi:glycerol-3-phosphate dehydrogenase (NAD(P)+)